MNAYLKKLFLYTGWANRIILNTVIQAQVSDDYITKSLSHLISAQFIWLGRITGYQHHYQLWEPLPVEQMYAAFDENTQLWLQYIETTADENFDGTIAYSNSVGDTFESVIRDCMVQVINHSTYHRAQVAKVLRDIGVVPPNTDYITYCRKTGETA